MRIKKLHNWDLSYSAAANLQKTLASQVKFDKLPKKIQTVAGLDCAFSKDATKILACAIVVRLDGFKVIETATAVRKVEFPYIPGLLSFREGPVCIEAVEKLKHEPDLFIVDGQGFSHPRRLGLASHLGLFFDKPTIGCAKSRLIGQYAPPTAEKGGYTWLKDKEQIVGAVVRTRTNIKPVFVSTGHKCLLAEAIKLTLQCTSRYRLPEPTRLAHQRVSKLRLDI